MKHAKILLQNVEHPVIALLTIFVKRPPFSLSLKSGKKITGLKNREQFISEIMKDRLSTNGSDLY
ncbi:MAG: hypothetical protein JRN15_22190, partial [Nitrososphaerota archaeon]|nr:hypothetical protein [Nitrososphaerota archaeon]